MSFLWGNAYKKDLPPRQGTSRSRVTTLIGITIVAASYMITLSSVRSPPISYRMNKVHLQIEDHQPAQQAHSHFIYITEWIFRSDSAALYIFLFGIIYTMHAAVRQLRTCNSKEVSAGLHQPPALCKECSPLLLGVFPRFSPMKLLLDLNIPTFIT